MVLESQTETKQVFLKFSCGNKHYAIPAIYIAEIVPYVPIQPIPHGSNHVAGMMNFHGVPIPVIDVCDCTENTPTPKKMHSRIAVILIEKWNPHVKWVGILAENMTEILRIDFNKVKSISGQSTSMSLIKSTLTDFSMVIQLLDIEKLSEIAYQVVESKNKILN